MLRIATKTATAMAAALKTELDGGFLYIFDGPVPASASDATTNATLLATITESDDGSTGLTFETPTTGMLTKDPGETWEGTTTGGGTAVFFRFCEDGDNPESADAGAHRIQGLCSTNPFTGQLIMPTTTLGNGVSIPIAAFSFIVPEA